MVAEEVSSPGRTLGTKKSILVGVCPPCFMYDMDGENLVMTLACVVFRIDSLIGQTSRRRPETICELIWSLLFQAPHERYRMKFLKRWRPSSK